MLSNVTRFTRLVRVCFVLYTLILLTATHWPKLTVPGPIPRPDLVAHLGAFGLWTILLGLTGWVSSKHCIMRQSLLIALIGICFGIIDETTQPLVSRVFDWTDIAANITGAILGSLALMTYWSWKNNWSCRIQIDSASDSMDQPPANARS